MRPDPLQKYGVSLLLAAFRRMGVFRRAEEKYEIDDLSARLGIVPGYSRLFPALLRILDRAGCLRITGSRIKTTESVTSLLNEAEIDLLYQNPPKVQPEFAAHAECLRVCLQAYPEILTGRQNHIEVLFPKGSLSRVEAIYKTDTAAHACGGLTANLIARCVQAHRESSSEPIRILEAGAGTGATSALVLPRLAEAGPGVDFVYTDISPAFLEHGRKSYGAGYPFVRFERLDLETDPAEQGFQGGQMDLIFACNVLHATREIAETLAHLRWLLRPAGVLTITEVTQAHDFATLLFGLTSGWWRFHDDEIRIPDSPLLTSESWVVEFAKAGFGNVEDLTPAIGQWTVLAAESNATRLELEISTEPAESPTQADILDSGPRTREAIIDEIRAAFSGVLRIPPARIRPDATFEKFGVDSLVALELSKRLEQKFGPLPASLLFEFDTAGKLAAHLATLSPAAESREVSAECPDVTVTASPCRDSVSPPNLGNEPIAIVGLAGRYPLADSPAAFWENLRSGRNCVGPFPEHRLADLPAMDRADWHGGFLDRIDEFDPAFFGISPAEAEYMDPQERLWIETAWHAMEDSGYTRARFESLEAADRSVGVFVGCMYSQYPLVAVDPAVAARLAAGGHWSIANRTSYLLHLRGPSIAIDTACSSSLTAIHLACQSIRVRECGVAIAGGVNLTIHPGKHEALRGAALLADAPESRAFGQSTGLLPGEGVGAVVLKPLSSAIADGDFIYGVVLGSAVNHGGKTSSYRIPSPEAQEELIRRSLGSSDVAIESVSYVEAAANGSPLGDPLEIAGLRRVFGTATVAIGSVKSNLGHPEAASGIAQLTKVLGQFRDGALYPTIHTDPRNPELGIEETGFRVVTELEAWDAASPRRAAISSFGAGGANAHIVVEEYAATPAVRHASPRETGRELILLSANTAPQLLQQCERLLGYLDASQPALSDLAFSLQTGREALTERLAITVSSIKDLQSALGKFQRGEPGTALRGRKEDDSDLQDAFGGPAGSAFLKRLCDDRDFSGAAALWVRGVEFDWENWHTGRQVRWVPLPGYRFAKRRCWIASSAPQSGEYLHPLVHRQIKRDGSIAYTSRFSGLEPFLAQHRINDVATMPAAALLEMARASAELCKKVTVTRLSRLAWTKPFQVRSGEPAAVEIHLTERSDDQLEFRILSGDGELASGTAGFRNPTPGAPLPAGSAGNAVAEPAGLYAAFERAGLRLGPHFQSLDSLRLSSTGVRADLVSREPQAGFVWQPGLLDGVLQTLAGFRKDTSDPALLVPFWIDTVEVQGAIHESAKVWASPTPGRDGSFDISVWNGAGEPALALRGVQTRAFALHKPDAAPEFEDLEALLARLAGEILKLGADEVPLNRAFPDFGFDSASLVAFARCIGERLSIELSPAELFARPTIAQLAAQIKSKQRKQVPAHRAAAVAPAAEPIAIIGLAAQFPGSADTKEFWRHLEAGDDLVTEVPVERWNWRDFGPDTPARWGGFLNRVDLFDPLFFGISPREAALMDPQHRLFLETVWHTIENAGYPPSQLAGTRTGLFVGVATNDYSDLLRASASGVESQMATGIAHSILANRISYLLDLRGLSQPIDTACSSSLVAIHHAVEAIRRGHCEMALAGGVNVILSPVLAMGFGKAGFMSPSGRCRAFGEGADGYVRGEGVGAILLKPLERAFADGDHIHAVIRSAVVNHGGRSASLTAPNSGAQSALLREAWRHAGVDAASIGYIEAHGTGTALGDPIEVLGIKEALENSKGCELQRTLPCWLGSVKSNFGHLEAAAGIAGIIKTVLALRHATIPPTLHTGALNRHLPLAGTTIQIARRAVPWPQITGQPRRGGVSSFGFGGTNAHVVLEEAPAGSSHGLRASGSTLAVLSARTPERLREYARVLANFLDAQPELDVYDVCHTLRNGREHLDARWAAPVDSLSGLTIQLRTFAANVAQPSPTPDLAPWLDRTGPLPPSPSGRRIPLPGYPFERNSHWFRPRRSKLQTVRQSETITLSPNEPRISGHRVGEELVCAGAILVDEALRVGSREGGVRLSRWTWLHPLVVTAEPLTLRIRREGYEIEIQTADGLPVANGELAPHAFRGATIEIPRLERSVSADNLYETFSSAGVSYGKWFRRITQLAAKGQHAWARFSLPALDQETPRADLLDAAMHCASFLALANSKPGLPHALANLEWELGQAPISGWIHASQQDDAFALEVAGDDGRVFLRIGSLLLRQPPGKAHLSCSTPQWSPESGDSAGPSDSPWLLTGPESEREFANGVAAALSAANYRPADQLVPENISGTICYIAPVGLGLDTSTQFLGFLQTLMRGGGGSRPISLTVITRGAQKVTAADVIHPDQAGVIGLALAAAREIEAWSVQSIDLPADSPPEELASVLSREDGDPFDRRLAYRAKQRYVQRLVTQTIAAGGDAWRKNGVYFITGAYGNIGTSLARHLALTCKARLVLLSRRQPGPGESRLIRHLEELGAQVLPISADLADAKDCRRAVDAAVERFGEIHGVFHCALLLENRMLAEITPESLQRVCCAKYDGTLNLCQALIGRASGFLCIFSSIASISGSVGQANYVAASALQDAAALAESERNNFSVRVINWGYWEDGGSDEQTRQLMERMAIAPIRPREAFAWLRQWLAADGARQLVVAPKGDAKSSSLPSRKFASSRQEAATRVAEILGGLLNLPPSKLDPATPLEAYGLDSIVTLEFCDALEPSFGAVTPAEIFENRTINNLAALLSASTDNPSNAPHPPELLVLAPRGRDADAPSSYWVHGAPGYAQVFRPLAGDAAFPVYAFQARGIDGTTPPFSDFGAMADYYCECIERTSPDRAVILGGYSLGGVVALEVARRWRRAGNPVELLVLLDTYPNTAPVEELFSTLRDQGFYQIMLANMFLASRGYAAVRITEAELDGVPRESRLSALARIVSQRNSGVPPEQDIQRALLGTTAVSNATGEAFRRFAIEPYDASPVLFLRASRGFVLPDEGPFVGVLSAFREYDYLVPWREIIRSPLYVESVDSDHFSLLAPENTGLVRGLIDDALIGVGKRVR